MRLPRSIATRGWLFLLLAGYATVWTLELAQYPYPLDFLFGGDVSNQMGIATHIYNGNAPWEDGSLRGEWAFRDWLMYSLVALSAKILDTTPLQITRFWPVVAMVAGGFALHGLARALWGRERYALLAAGLWMGVQTTMLPTSRYFAALVTVPLFFWAMAAYKDTTRHKLALGLAWGAASLSYLVAFFGTTMAGGLFLLHRARWRPLAALREARTMWPTWLAGAPIVLALWGPIFLVYGGDVKNPSHYYGDAARGWTLEQSMAPIADLVGHYDGYVWAGMSLLTTLGLVAGWRARARPSGAITWIVLVVGLVGTYHWLLTLPLFDNHLVYYRWPTVFLRLAQTLLVLHAIVMLDAIARTLWSWRPRPAGASTRPLVPLAAIVVGLLLVPASVEAAYRDIGDNARALARDDRPDRQVTQRAADWLNANAPKDAVLLGTPFDSFAMNALTGIDLVVQRRPHANAFVDHDKRYADAVLMMMGDDVELGRRLAAEYGVTHAFFGPLLIEFLVKQDPFLTSPAYADAWRAAGVEPHFTRLPYDPVGQGQKFDVIVPKEPKLGRFIVEDWDIVFTEAGERGNAVIMEYRHPR